MLISYIEPFLRIVLPVMIALIISKILMHVKHRSKKINQNISAIFLILFVKYLIWFLAFLIILNNTGFTKSWETALAGSGVMAVVLGLAAQSTFANVFSGIAFSSSSNRPFEIGDRVKIGNIDPGYVKNITFRHVEIRTYLNETIFIPNSIVGSSIVINYTDQDGSSYPVEIMVAYESDLDKAMKIMEYEINNHPKHYGRNNVVLCKETCDSGILLKGTVTTKSFDDTFLACSEVLKNIIKRFQEEGIEIPYNKIAYIKYEPSQKI